MFGYIKPYKPEMKMSEFDTFKGIYCGLCKQLSHVYGPFSSLTLSYDFTFIATVSLGLSNDCIGFKRCSCVANPLKKKMCHVPCEELTFCAGCAMLMIYYKVLDNIKDSGFLGKLKALAAFPFAKIAQRRAKKLYPEADLIIKTATQAQTKIEKSYSNQQGTMESLLMISLDRAADPTATALGKLCEFLNSDESQKPILYRFGYLVGRYVYFADALDDLESDQKHKEFNPFLRKFPDNTIQQTREYAVGLINITIAEIAPAFELLNFKRFKPILENIIYLGLHNSIKEILSPNNKKTGQKERNINEQSL